MHSMLQHCPSWTLRAWPPLLWQVSRPVPRQLQHLGTQVTNPGESIRRSMGQTLWAWHSADGDMGMAWDWVQLTPGVVAMADPMAVVTNLRLVGEEGEELTAYEAALHFNAIVHALAARGRAGVEPPRHRCIGAAGREHGAVAVAASDSGRVAVASRTRRRTSRARSARQPLSQQTARAGGAPHRPGTAPCPARPRPAAPAGPVHRWPHLPAPAASVSLGRAPATTGATAARQTG